MTLSLVVWEIRYSLRQAVRQRFARVVLSAALLVVTLGPFFYYLLRPPLEYALTLDVVVGFVALNLLFSSAAAALGISYLIDAPQRLEALSLAPLESGRALLIALSPAVFMGLVPVTALLLPYALLAARLSPFVAFGAVVTGVCVLCWALVAAVALAALLIRRMGLHRAGLALRAVAGVLGVVTTQFFGRLVRIELGAPVLVAFLIASPLALGPLSQWAAQSLGAALGRSEAPRLAQEPSWGRYSLMRQLWNSTALVAVVGLVPAMVVVWLAPSARMPIISMLSMVVTNGPVERILESERASPDRLALAPRGATFQRHVFMIGGGVWLLSVVFLFVGLWGERAWVGLHAAFMLSMLATNAVPSRVARTVLQGCLLLVDLFVASGWSR